jgi:hypothetical protein
MTASAGDSYAPHYGRLNRWLLRRYHSVATPYAAAGAVVYGALLGIGDARSYSPPALVEGPFAIAPRWAWVVLFVTAGTLVLTIVRAWAVGALVACLFIWAATLALSTWLLAPDSSPTGPVWPAVVAVTLAASVAVRGAGHHRRRRG